MPPLHADIVPVLNERAANQVADQMERQFGDAGRGSATAFGRLFSDGLGGLRSIGADAGTQFGTGLRAGIDDAIRGATSQFGSLGDSANGVLTGMTRGAGLAAVGVAGIGVAAVAAGQQLYDLGAQWDDIGDSIAVRTGKLGDDLDRITGMVRDLGAETAAPLESIGDIAGRVSQAMGLTGNDLRDVTQAIANLNEMTGEQANIRQLSKTFRIFDIDGGDQVAALDSLFNTSQATGASINELIESMSNAAKATSQFGMGFGETAALLTTFEEAGVDINKVAPAMTIALRNFSAASREPQAALRDTIVEIKNLSEAGRDFEATRLASETFGRGYIDFLNAIKDGNLDVDAITRSFEKQGPTIQETRDATADLSEEWTKFKNQLQTELAPAAETVFSGINQMIQQYLIRPLNELKGISNLWGLLDSGAAPMPINPLTGLPADQSNALAGTRDSGGVRSPTGLPDSQANAPAGTRDSGGVTPNMPPPVAATGPSPWWPADMIPEPDNPRFGSQYDRANGASGPRLPAAPSVPYAPLPGLAPGLEMTASLYSAQSAVADAETRAAEKQARLNQLRQTNAATEDERQNAENEAFKAERDADAARMRFHEAQQSAFEQQNKQLDKLATDIGEFGAQIDDDFGASEGLAGIAENVTKFLANIAFAPAYGALAAVREANGFGQGEAGSGLLGALGGSGAFGDQYRAVPRWMRGDQGGAAAAMGPAAFGGGVGLPGAGGAPTEDQVKQIAAAFGLQVTSEDRPGDPGYHGSGMALDLSNGGANTPEMRAFADYMAQNFGSSLKELIYSDGTFSNLIGDGQNVTGTGYYSQGTLAEHQNHVHVAADWGSGGTGAPGMSGMPSAATPNGALAASLFQDPLSGTWRSSLPEWDALMQRESGGINQRQQIIDSNSGGNEAEGLFQITPQTWNANGGGAYASSPLSASPQQQAAIAQNIFNRNPTGSDWGAGMQGRENPAQLQAELAGPGAGAPGMAPPTTPGMPNLAGVPMLNGGPLANGMPSAGLFPGRAAPSRSVSGGREYAAGQPASGGIGIGGGLLGMLGSAVSSAAGAAGTAAGMGMDGGAGGAVASAVADMGIQQLQRAAGAMGQYAGALAGGAIETFALNGSALGDPSSSWLGRIAAAVPGVRPALPNSAGMLGGEQNPNMAEAGKEQPPGAMDGPPGPLSPEDAAKMQAGQGGNTDQSTTVNNNVTVNNPQTRDLDGAMRDTQTALGNQNSARLPR